MFCTRASCSYQRLRIRAIVSVMSPVGLTCCCFEASKLGLGHRHFGFSQQGSDESFNESEDILGDKKETIRFQTTSNNFYGPNSILNSWIEPTPNQ